jgi:hypothetical protein
MGRRKRSKNKSSKNTSKTLSLITRCLEWIWDLDRLWFYWIVSCIDCTSSCIEWDVWKTWMHGVVVIGGIYSPNHQFNRWGGCLSMGAPDTVRCASHVTQPLGFWRFRPLELWHFAASDSPVLHRTGTVHYPVRLMALLCLCANCQRTVHVAGDRWSRPLRSLVVAPLGAPDSPMAHRTVRWIIVERRLRNPKVKSSTCIVPGAPNTVRWHTG